MSENRVEWRVPQLGNGVESMVVEEWMVGVGEQVRQGEPIIVVETDKASMELVAPVTGTLAAVMAEDGKEIEVGEVLAEFEPA